MQQKENETLRLISSVSVRKSHQDQTAQPHLIPFTVVFEVSVYIATQMLATYQGWIMGRSSGDVPISPQRHHVMASQGLCMARGGVIGVPK